MKKTHRYKAKYSQMCKLYDTESLLKIVLLKKLFIVSLKCNTSITIIVYEDRINEKANHYLTSFLNEII